MQLYLGVDGGGTGCRAAICDAGGRMLGAGGGGSANIATDFDGARANILAAVGQAMEAAGAEPGQLVAVLGLAGANVGDGAARLAAGLPFAQVRIETDALIALKGAHGQGDGIAATLGTGSVYACQRGGAVRMLGGWGFHLGDEGSGAWLGRAALQALVQAEDGMLPLTPMLRAVGAQVGGADAAVGFARGADPAAFAGLARAVIMAPDDAVSAGILAVAEAAIARSIDHLMGDAPVPLAFLGGLGRFYAGRLAGRYGALIRAPLGSPLEGALTMARAQ